MEGIAAVLVRLGAPEIGQHVGERPAVAAHLPPAVIVTRVAADIDHSVDRGRAAPAASARPVEAAVVQVKLALGLVVPVVGIGLAEQGGDARGHMDHRRSVAPAGLDQQHLVVRIGGEAVGEHAARAPRADDDVVEGLHGCIGTAGLSVLSGAGGVGADGMGTFASASSFWSATSTAPWQRFAELSIAGTAPSISQQSYCACARAESAGKLSLPRSSARMRRSRILWGGMSMPGSGSTSEPRAAMSAFSA